MRRPPKSKGTPEATSKRPSARPTQLELFATPLRIVALDPRRAGGARTRVRDVYMVRYGTEARAHRVFHDRHGWYCDEHGLHCKAVGDVRGAIVNGDPIEQAVPWPPMVTGDLFD